MLKQLHIENYAIIEHLDIEFAPSLNIITGETGAGKSILLGALGLLSGVRADSSVIASGAERCIVEGVFGIAGYGLEALFSELDLDFADEVIIRRVIQSGGKSRAFIGDLPVTLQTLKSVSEVLIDIHSQHQTLLLAKGDFQRQIIDAVARNTEKLTEYQTLYKEWQSAAKRVEELRQRQREAATQSDYISFQIEQLEGANIQRGEEESLQLRESLLSNAEEITTSFSSSASLLSSEEGGALELVRSATNSLRKIDEHHTSAGELSERLESCYIELKDIAEELSDLALSIEANPRELEAIELRLDTIYTLCKKHGVNSGDSLCEVLDKFRADFEAIEGGVFAIEEAVATATKLYQKVETLAAQLSNKRKEAIPSTEKFIASSLLALGIKHPNFKVSQQTSPIGAYGCDSIEFLFSANEKSTPQPIGAVASGGEMSRLMLSIKHLVSKEIQLPTIIFDEIDTGVSGAVADSMGSIIESMSNSMQVINITHLPQVAAKGENHFEVYKDSGSHIRKLSQSERIERIAAMLSGATVTEAAVKQAKELLKGIK
ncbi:MAG: DNA repair protein RecN [Rikenellaceae bacterium]